MSITINGNDARTFYGLLVDEPGGLLVFPSRRFTSAPVPTRAGETRTSTIPIESPRDIILNGTILGTTAADARTKADTLKEALGKDPVALISGDNLTRSIQALLTSLSIGTPGAYFLNKHLRVSAALLALDPFWYETTPVSMAVGTNSQVVLGTAPSRPVITIVGGTASAVTFTFKHNNGATLQTITVTIALIAGDTLVIDCDKMTIKKGGVSVIGNLSAGDFFTMDIKDSGSYAGGAWPTMSMTGYTGGTVTMVYSKAWR